MAAVVAAGKGGRMLAFSGPVGRSLTWEFVFGGERNAFVAVVERVSAMMAAVLAFGCIIILILLIFSVRSDWVV